MHTWTLSLRASAESGLPSVDVEVRARDEATVADLARSLGHHLAPDQPRLDVVPVTGGQPWPAERPLAECGLRTGYLLDVTTATASWRETRAAGSRPRAVLRVLEGPDRGARIQVRGSALTLGRGQHCTLRLTDPLVSHHHARIVLGARPTVHDEGSANGTSIDGEPVSSPREVDWGTPIRLGHTTVAVDLGQAAPQESPVSVFRPPRFGQPLAEGILEVDAPPERRRPSPLPWAMFALPVVMGLAMFMRSQTPYSLVYMLAWPLVGYFGWRQQRRQAEREFQEDLAAWRADVDDTLETLDARAVEQRQRLYDDHPALDVVRDRVVERDPYLWARRDDRSGFLQTRVGIGPVPALLRGSVKDGGEREARRECQAELAERDVLGSLPVLAPVGEHPLIAVTGEPEAVDAFARAVVVRLAYDHSPNDLTFAGCLSRGRSEHESWLRWLPHTAVRLGGEQPIAFGSHHGAALLDHLLGEDDAGHTVCLVDADAGIPRRNVEAASAAAGARNLHLVWLGRDAAEVPANTSVLVDLAAGGRATVSVSDRGGVVEVDTVDQVSLADAWRIARLMTGYVDEAAVLPPSTAIPSLVRLSDMSSDFEDLDDAEAVRHRWGQSAGLRAQVGTGADGVVTIDLREDGPHGLVAGTTGSGKSELLQSLICSLALNNPPSRINFLLVDYKGGAAFRECGDLPHTVGYITDLTPALVSRALTSLGAEITAREHLLGEYGVKDLVQLERERPEVAPPSLLICVDEFAALTAEVPEFVDGMVNIAQRGRSLGMHVVLATQRPAGVVTGNIRANTDLRIALRVSSREDSDDVIDSPDAARISRRTPGRAWIRRTGHGTAELVQSAWTGARQPVAGSEEPVVVRPFSAATGESAEAPTGAPARLHPHTDLERCVTTIASAFALSGAAAPPRPWLPPLPGELLLDADELGQAARARRSGRVCLGRIDEPEAQAQPDLVVDFAVVGHLLVHGASGSGKTELLRTSVLSASWGDASSADELAPYVYGIDFAGGGLAAIADLPTVEAVVPQAHPGRVQRLIRLLERTMTDRAQLLAARGCADLDELATTGQRLPRVYVALDNLPALVESLESAGGVAREHVEKLQEVLQNGRRVGIHVIATAPGRGGIPGSLGAAFGQRIVLRMNVPDDYLMLGVPGAVLDADSSPGSGLLGRRSIQVATTGGAGTPEQGRRIARWGELLAAATEGRASAPVPAMPTRLDSQALPAPTGSRVPVGVDAAAAAVIEADLRAGPVLIAGRPGSGRTSALDGLAALVARGEQPPYVIREDTATKAAELLRAWLEDTPADSGPEVSGSWCLLMVDDAEVWDTEAGVDEGSRAARDEVMAAVSANRTRLAVVAAADMGQARARSIGATFVDAVRQGRRGFLLQPEWNDGEVLGVTVPTKTTEPLSGIGRGLWCEGGSAIVAQLVTAAPTTASTTDERGVR